MSAAAARATWVGAYEPALHDRFRIPDGREGDVIGFYRFEDDSVVVLFPSGESETVLAGLVSLR